MSVQSSSTPAKNNVDKSGKHKEKDDMVGLNDKFVQLIDKMKHLEDENRKLETKLNILKDQGGYKGKIDDIVRDAENNLKQKIEDVLLDQEKLQKDLLQKQKETDDIKKRYQDEVDKKDDLEKDFMISKKALDNIVVQKVELQLELEDLIGKQDFLRAGFDEEIRELESQIQNETVVLPDNRKRSLDLDDYIENARNQYADMAARAREEAEQWHQRKIEAMVGKLEKGEQDVRETKREISDMTRKIQRLNGDQEGLKRKEDALKKDIDNCRENGEENVKKAKDDIAQLEEALKNAKQELAGRVREHQDLMNVKMALDIEINTYRALLEGEEERMYNFMHNADVHLLPKKHLPEKPPAPTPTIVPATTIVPASTIVPPTSVIPPTSVVPPTSAVPLKYPASKKRLLIQVEVKLGRVVSESSRYTED